MSRKNQRQIDLATRMISKYGKSVVWQKQAESVLDETKPWKTSATAPNKFDTTILFLKPSGGLAQALYHLIKGTDTPNGAPRGLMSFSENFTPEITDSVVRDGSVLIVKTINAVAPGDDVIMYDIEFA